MRHRRDKRLMAAAVTAITVGAVAMLFAVFRVGGGSPEAVEPATFAEPVASSPDGAVPSSAGPSTSPSASASPSPGRSPSRAPSLTPGAAAVLAGWPTPRDQEPVSATKAVSGEFDGRMKRFYGTGTLGDGGQGESQVPLFKLGNGAVLRNVVIGAPAADGVHCTGTCTLINVWWEDVGEDAATFKGTSAGQTMTVDGGGARAASDKVFQHNGPGKMVIRNFQVSDFGKLYRSCGNCSTQYPRHVVVSNVRVNAPGGKTLVGINTNFGDTATLSGITVVGDPTIAICERYRGVTSGEPSKIGTGPDGTNCRYTASDVTYR
jgi:pectate lyase